MFQSRSLMSSPGTYLRCSENSTEKPWNGLPCRPARKPSTMNLARRSSRATWRMTSGFRYFSGLLIEGFAVRFVLTHYQCTIGGEEALAIDLVDAGGLVSEIAAQHHAHIAHERLVHGMSEGLDGQHLGRADDVLEPTRLVGTGL